LEDGVSSATEYCSENNANLLEELTPKVIIDSNFLFLPSQFQIDIFEELLNLLEQHFDPVLLSVTQQELLSMARRGSPKIRRQASLAIRLAKKCCLVQIRKGEDETPDDVVVRMAQKWKCPVATNDQMLRRRLRSKGIPVIFLREKTRLALEGSL
jgi:rRNA-processing protein FCF1